MLAFGDRSIHQVAESDRRAAVAGKVLDLFGGSGTTLIACERRGRRARLMELDPKYADCIVRRFQDYSGKSAVLDGDGRSYDAIAKERTEETE